MCLSNKVSNSESNLQLIRAIINRRINGKNKKNEQDYLQVDLEDLYQVAVMGVIKASKTIDDTIDSITKNYINMIENKISNFEIKIKGRNKAWKC